MGADPDPDVDDFCVVGHVEDDNTTVIIAVVVAVVVTVIGVVLILVIKKFVLGKFSASFPSDSSLLFSEYRLSKSFVFSLFSLPHIL